VLGFDLHAGIAVRAGARERLERLCRYALRPAVGQERMRLSPEGQVVLELRRRWANGTTHLVFDLVELLERLAALVPRPRINLVLYHAVLAPRAAWRRAIVPVQAADDSHDSGTASECRHERVGRRPNWDWAELMERSFPPSPRLRRASLKRFARKRVGGAGVSAVCGANDAAGSDP
jgi:hypothetical protein